MSLQYLVNGKVVFEPQSYRLWAVDSPEASTTLFVPASECFALLLENSGEVLSQQTLFEQVWEKNGLYASSNTLYQNIAVLRKSLKATGLEEEVIKTIPRQGFAFIGKADKQQSDQQTEYAASAAPEKINNSASERSIQKAVAFSGWSSWVPLLLIFIAIVLLGWALLAPESGTQKITAEYSNQGIVDGCKLYSSWPGKAASEEHFKQAREVNNIECRRGEYVYLSFDSQTNFTSVIECTLPVENGAAECVNFLNRNLKNEHN